MWNKWIIRLKLTNLMAYTSQEELKLLSSRKKNKGSCSLSTQESSKVRSQGLDEKLETVLLKRLPQSHIKVKLHADTGAFY